MRDTHKEGIKEGIDKLLRLCLSCHTITPACTCDVISNTPILNTIALPPVLRNLLQYIVDFITKYTITRIIK